MQCPAPLYYVKQYQVLANKRHPSYNLAAEFECYIEFQIVHDWKICKLPKWNWIIKIKVIKNQKLDKNQKAHLGYLGRDWFNLLCPGGCSASSSALLTTCSILIVRLAIIIRYSCCSIMPFFYGVCFFVWKFNWDQFNHCISFFLG